MKGQKKYLAIILITCGTGIFHGCADFLDIVPDNVFQYEDLFGSRSRAMNALSECYHAVPYDEKHTMPWVLGDEFVITNFEIDSRRDCDQGSKIMRGQQSATNTLMSFWTGNLTYTGSFYTIIRDCDMFIQNIDNVPDMTTEEKADFKAQAQVLKAYYLFWLVNNYGPVVIPKTASPNSPQEDLLLPRSKVEDCFQYIISLLDEAIPQLKWRSSTNDLGLIDRCAALSLKARFLLYRASPFFNGNTDYAKFLDSDGEPFFPQKYDPEKWKQAADAADEAITACESHNIHIYHYAGNPYTYDEDDWKANTERMKVLYDNRLKIFERWNSEIIWGVTKATVWNMAELCSITKTAGYGGPAAVFDGGGYAGSSYQAMARYFTEHGLPLKEDKSFNMNTLHEIVRTPEENSEEYGYWRGYLQPGVPTIKMYLHREPRFYTDLGITGGYYRAFQVRINTMMMYDTDGGFVPGFSEGFYNSTGIGIQKCMHPESYDIGIESVGLAHQVTAPYPLMRLADLYLMKAEAMNEYYGPSQEVFDAVNLIRKRAGIPTVEESYTGEWVSDDSFGKHTTKDGMRDIIYEERQNEFAFEAAHRFYDCRRLNRASQEFSGPVYGWNYLATTPEVFFKEKIVQSRTWSGTQNLWPIDSKEMERNSKLVQNPGW